MKHFFTLTAVICLAVSMSAQKVAYKKNIISVDGKTVAKVEVQKENFGLTKNFNLYSMDGEKLVIAVLSTEYQSDPNDNMGMFYRLTFVPTDQVGIFRLPTLGMEKGFADLIGKGQIVEGNNLNADKVAELITSKGVTPRTTVNYMLVVRNKRWPIELREDKTIEQGGEQIGFFTSTGHVNGVDMYEFFVPDGIMIVKVSFAGGNNAQNFELFTARDNVRKVIRIPQEEKVDLHTSSIDPNALTLKRITAWLVENNYL